MDRIPQVHVDDSYLRDLLMSWRRVVKSVGVSEEQSSITLLSSSESCYILPQRRRRRCLAASCPGRPQVITVRGQLVPPRAATLHWLRRIQRQLMRESSPAAVRRVVHAQLTGTPPLRRISCSACLRYVDGRGDDDRFRARVVPGAVAGSAFVSTSGSVLTG